MSVHVHPLGHPRRVRGLAKACVDLGGATILIILSVPLLVAATVAILLFDGRPILFSQTRVGRNGRPFTMWKLRTMRRDAEAMRASLLDRNELDGHTFKMRGDPRATRLGRGLRRFSIDELPQLWNVIRGDMSLVGPRPLLPDEVQGLADVAHWRLGVRPGITGLWQVSGRADLPWRDAERLDRHYLDNWSVALDIVVLWRTIGAVLSGRGAY